MELEKFKTKSINTIKYFVWEYNKYHVFIQPRLFDGYTVSLFRGFNCLADSHFDNFEEAYKFGLKLVKHAEELLEIPSVS